MPRKRKLESEEDVESRDEDAALRHEEMAGEIEARVQELTNDTATEYLDNLCTKWKLDDPTASFSDTAALYFRNYGLDISSGFRVEDVGSYGVRGIEESARGQEMEVVALYHRLRELGMLTQEEIHVKIRSVMESVYLSKKFVFLALQGKMVEHRLTSEQPVELDDDLDAQLGSWSLRFRWLNDKTLSDVQKLLLHLLDAAMELKYKKQGSYCFEPVVSGGYKTHAYRQVCDIEDFVYDQCTKELQLEQWLNLTAGNNNAKVIIEYLTKTDDYQFRKLQKDRHVFAFKNGVYFAKEDRFHRFDSGVLLEDRVVAAKYFDLDFLTFDDVDDWYDIPTPNFQSILEYQQFPREVIRWAYILIGRLMYDVGELDGWQVIMFVKGFGGSGKSTIINMCKDLYDAVDVGILSNNIEKKFGIGAFYDKYIFVAPEIKQDLSIEQAEFQSMVTGESLSVAVKHKKAFSAVWKPPGILAGNEVPAWADNSGSIQRRVVLFGFEQVVKNGDMRLSQKIKEEMPQIMCKANKAYLDASAKYGDKDVWSVLPAYFKNTRDEMAQTVNSVEAFLSSSEVVLHPDKFCPFDDFKAALKSYEVTNGFKGVKYVLDLFRGPFSKFNIKRVRDTKEYRGRRLHREYLLGVDVVDQMTINELG